MPHRIDYDDDYDNDNDPCSTFGVDSPVSSVRVEASLKPLLDPDFIETELLAELRCVIQVVKDMFVTTGTGQR